MASWIQWERFGFALILTIGGFGLVVVFLLKYPYGEGSVDCSTLATFLLPVFFVSLMPIGFYLEHLFRYGTLRGVRVRDEVPKIHHWILSTLVLAGGAAVTVVALVRFSPDCRFSLLVSLFVALSSTILQRYVKVLFPKS